MNNSGSDVTAGSQYTEAPQPSGTADDSADVWVNTDRPFYLALVAIGLLGTFSNGFVILVITRFTKMSKKIPGLLILNQSCVDGLDSFLLFCDQLVYYNYGFGLPGGETFRRLYCRLYLTSWLQWGLLCSSVWNLLAVNLERYLSVVWPVFHKNITFKKFALPAILIVWLYGPIFDLFWAQISTYMEDGYCMLYAFHGNVDLSTAYSFTLILTSFFIPLASMIYFYAHMIWVLRSKGSWAAASQKNLFKTILIVTMAMVASWTMDVVCWTLYNTGAIETYAGALYYSSYMMISLGACVNPFIYIAHYREFKAGMRKMLGWKRKIAPGDLSNSGQSVGEKRSTTTTGHV